MKISQRALLEEALRREQVKQSKGLLVRALRDEMFSNQNDFIEDSAREKGALCTRRAGKTTMWPRYCTIVAQLIPRAIVRIWGITRLRTKQLLWDEFKLLIARHKIKANFNETELTIRFDNGSEIRFLGADKDKEVQKKRGDKTVLEVVLEAQLFGPYLKTLVEDVAGPCLFDMKGTFCLEGTPGPVCAGHWYDVSGGEDLAKRWTSAGNSKKDHYGAGWSMHRWSVLDNPYLPHAKDELAALKAKRRWADDNPTYVREWLGRWVNDYGSLYYRFDSSRNTFTLDEIKPWGPGWEHTLGWDLGFKDDMAMVVWGFHPAHAELYEAFSWKKPGALSPEIVETIRGLEKHGVDGTPFNIIARVADTGGGGRMYVEEVSSRYSMSFEAAKKTDKYEHVRLLNDDLSGGLVRLRAGSQYAEEIAVLLRDLDWPPPEKPEAEPREDPRCANHCSDAGLYGYRRAFHYLHVDEIVKPKRGTPSWFESEATRLEQMALKEETKKQRMLDDDWFANEVDAEWE